MSRGFRWFHIAFTLPASVAADPRFLGAEKWRVMAWNWAERRVPVSCARSESPRARRAYSAETLGLTMAEGQKTLAGLAGVTIATDTLAC